MQMMQNLPGPEDVSPAQALDLVGELRKQVEDLSRRDSRQAAEVAEHGLDWAVAVHNSFPRNPVISLSVAALRSQVAALRLPVEAEEARVELERATEAIDAVHMDMLRYCFHNQPTYDGDCATDPCPPVPAG